MKEEPSQLQPFDSWFTITWWSKCGRCTVGIPEKLETQNCKPLEVQSQNLHLKRLSKVDQLIWQKGLFFLWRYCFWGRGCPSLQGIRRHRGLQAGNSGSWGPASWHVLFISSNADTLEDSVLYGVVMLERKYRSPDICDTHLPGINFHGGNWMVPARIGVLTIWLNMIIDKYSMYT